MNNQEYKEYLKTYEWKQRAKSEIERVGGACVICGCRENLLVHHLSYDSMKPEIPGDEYQKHLLVVCPKCHKMLHAAEEAQSTKMEVAVQKFASAWADVKEHEKILEDSIKEIYSAMVVRITEDYFRTVIQTTDKCKLKPTDYVESGYHSSALKKIPVEYAKKHFPDVDEQKLLERIFKIYKEENAKKR